MDIVAATSGSAGKTDVEDIFLEGIIIRLNNIIAGIIKHHMAGILHVGSHNHPVLRRRREADKCLHTSILNLDAIAMLSKLPKEVGPILFDSGINTLVSMF